MRILIATSEAHPYSKTGGLADMVGAFAKSLVLQGHQVGVVTPLYRDVPKKHPLQPFDWRLDLPLGDRWVHADVRVQEPQPGLTYYFIDQPGFFDRPQLYQENGRDYPDNVDRYVFLSKCVVNLARYLPWKPELVHVHDWQTALVPLLIQHQAKEGWGTPPRTCLTIHNLAYQGMFPAASFGLTNLPSFYFQISGAEFYGHFNMLKTGITYTDAITTVSPRYAWEILTPEFGCGLDGILRHRVQDLYGILNGVDYDEWNTTKNNEFLKKHAYSVNHLRGKTQCKAALQRELKLPQNPHIPVFGNVTRMTDQKGVDIQLGALEEMLSADIQCVILGTGSPLFERAYQSLANRHPDKVAVTIGFDNALSHRIVAGSDFYLMPSRFEPCGLNQMYSLRYGTIPIVRAVGGLDDTVTDITEDLAKADGIKFQDYSAQALVKSIRKALILYDNPQLLKRYRRNGMTKDCSWERTTKEYCGIFAALTGNG